MRSLTGLNLLCLAGTRFSPFPPLPQGQWCKQDVEIPLLTLFTLAVASYTQNPLAAPWTWLGLLLDFSYKELYF